MSSPYFFEISRAMPITCPASIRIKIEDLQSHCFPLDQEPGIIAFCIWPGFLDDAAGNRHPYLLPGLTEVSHSPMPAVVVPGSPIMTSPPRHLHKYSSPGHSAKVFVKSRLNKKQFQFLDTIEERKVKVKTLVSLRSNRVADFTGICNFSQNQYSRQPGSTIITF
ncbi:MAG: hypothetical protein J7K84_06150 [Deltaproteobacteria bacterium]|nr:hypothetical protein [Deltaproteobacteria bacterium]